MKHRTIATVLISFVLLCLMIWSFGSSAANTATNTKEQTSNANPSSPNEAGEIFQDNDEKDADADLGKFGSRISREEYIRERDEYVGLKRGFESGFPFNPAVRREAIHQMERQENGRKLTQVVSGDLTPAAGGSWTPIGPLSITNGQSLQFTDIAVSGRVTTVVVDPTNPNNVYLGTAQGGVWRSLNAGTTWESIFDSADSQAIGALAVPPSDPSKLYVGTGEFNGCGDCFFGAGLYRIDNVNTTPSLVGPINPSQTVGNLTYNIFNGRAIAKIVVDPTNAATIFVSTARGIGGNGGNDKGTTPPVAPRGLWRSTNATNAAGSITFQKLLVNTDSSVDTPGTGDANVTDIVMEPGVPNNLLVSVVGRTGLFGGIYRTTTALGTATFSQVYSTAAGNRISLAINKVGSVVTAYAATSEDPTTACVVADSGVVRKQVDPFNLSSSWATQLGGGSGFCGSQCFYDMPIAVNPNDANEVYLGGNARGRTQPLPADPCPDGVKKSTNGGATFTRDDTGLHADSHAFFYDTAGNIYAGNDGGIWKRSSSSAAGTAWTNLNSTPLNTLQFYSIAVHPTDQFMMIGGTQDNGTEYQQTSSGNWRNAEGGDGGYCLIDTSATDTVHVNMYHTFFNIRNDQIGFDRAVDTTCLPNKDFWPTRGVGFLPNGDNEIPGLTCDGTASYLHNGLQLSDFVLFYAPMALGPGSPNTVYFGTDRLYRSANRGDTMTVVSQGPIVSTGCGTGLANPCPISAIGIWPGGDNIRMIGTQNGQVWATSNGSATMVNLAPPIPANPSGSTNKFIGRATIDPNNKNVAYIVLSYYAPAGQGIWKITNLVAAAGSSPAAPVWAAAGNGIPSIPINGFAIDPQNSNNLYAGTDIGVYFSSDRGANWSPFGTGLPRSAVFDLQIQPSSRLLRAATHGRGVWETALVSPAPSTVQFNASSASVTEGESSITVTIVRGGDTSFPASVNYTTADDSGANGCGTNTGAASSRCDYIATSGTLNFAANEASQQISIPLWSDSYIEGAETFRVVLSAAGGNNVSLGAPSTITITINDSGFNGANQIDQTEFYVRKQYIDFLNREPDPPGLAFWINNIDSCGANVGCREVRRIDTSAAFFLSIEFNETGYLVERIYKTAFGDGSGTSTLNGSHPVTVPIIRLNEFLPDTQRIGLGVIVAPNNAGNWQEKLEANKQAFMEEFVQRSRFLTALPLSTTPLAFVDALNDHAKDQNGNKPLSTAEHDNLVNALANGTMTRAQVLRAVAEDSDLAASEKNRAFVLMEYFGYLRRNPNDPQDSDYTGYDFWLTKLNQFNGNYQGAEMVKAFITSIEYRQRFAQ
jgi:hypothetical protein